MRQVDVHQTDERQDGESVVDILASLYGTEASAFDAVTDAEDAKASAVTAALDAAEEEAEKAAAAESEKTEAEKAAAEAGSAGAAEKAETSTETTETIANASGRDGKALVEDDAPEVIRRKHRTRTIISAIIVIILVPAVVLVGHFLDANYYLTSVIVLVLMVVPFFISFETRRPQARELVILAILSALAVVARVAFIWLPAIKPMVAIVIIAGVAFGGESGFLVGAIAIIVSNLVFGPGPWTPWQMFAIGLAGFVAGLLAQVGAMPREHYSLKQRIIWSVAIVLFIIVIVGPILDTCALFLTMSTPEEQGAIAIYISGFPVNVIHGLSAGVAFFFLVNPILDKLRRVKVKYGMMEASS